MNKSVMRSSFISVEQTCYICGLPVLTNGKGPSPLWFLEYGLSYLVAGGKLVWSFDEVRILLPSSWNWANEPWGQTMLWGTRSTNVLSPFRELTTWRIVLVTAAQPHGTAYPVTLQSWLIKSIETPFISWFLTTAFMEIRFIRSMLL